MAARLVELWIDSPKKIVKKRKANKANFLTPCQLALILLFLKKTKKEITRIGVRSNAIFARKKATMPANTRIECQKIRVGLGNIFINDWGWSKSRLQSSRRVQAFMGLVYPLSCPI